MDVLTTAIKNSGTLIHTPFAAQFDENGAKAYLNFVYGIYGDKVPEHKSIDDLTPVVDEEGNSTYYIMIAGHRRLKALQTLREEFVDVKVKKDIDPLDALYIQAQENTQKPLTDDERAEQHGRLWVVSKTREPKLTLEKFTQRVGVTITVLRRDIRFYNLPEDVKKYAITNNEENGHTQKQNRPQMPFNIACQLGRLIEAGAPTYDVLFLARRFFEENVTSERTASERVSKYLHGLSTNFESLEDLFGMNANRLRHSRKTLEVARRFAQPVDEAIGYFSRIKAARENGFADLYEDNLSFASAASRLVSLASLVEKLLPGMSEVIGDENEVKRISAIFQELDTVAQNIEEKISAQS